MSEVNLERQRAAGRAEWAARLQYFLALPPLLIAVVAGAHALTTANDQELIAYSLRMLEALTPAVPLIWRGISNEIRRDNLLDRHIANGDPRARTRRDYAQEIKGAIGLPPSRRMW